MRRSRLLSSSTQGWAQELYHAFQWKVLANSLPQMVVRPTNWHTWRSVCPLLRPVQLGAYSGRQKSTFLIKKVADIRKHYLEIHFFSDRRNIILFDGLSSKVHPGQVLLWAKQYLTRRPEFVASVGRVWDHPDTFSYLWNSRECPMHHWQVQNG